MNYGTLLAALLALILSGCAGFSSVKSAVAIEGAKVADAQLEAARWAICEMPTAGALRRRYANDPGGLAAWQAHCSTPGAAAVTP